MGAQIDRGSKNNLPDSKSVKRKTILKGIRFNVLLWQKIEEAAAKDKGRRPNEEAQILICQSLGLDYNDYK